MQKKSDAQLLREYAAQHSEPAFAEIVVRHTDLVYSAALRQTGAPELAREIAQNVFTDLARKAGALAGTLSADASLAGWLFRGTRFAGLKRLRDDHRRQTRERQFMEHFNPAAQAATDSAPEWERVAPVLDDAMAELSDADHEAVLLRYFENQDFHAVGLALGVSEAAAQRRVSRAVERLREFLAKRGVKAGASGLVVLISANAVLTAPAGLSAAIAATALAGTTLITATTATITKAIAMTTTQKVLITVALAAAVGTGIFEARQASAARIEIQGLKQQQALLADQLEEMTRERAEAIRQLATLRDQNEAPNRNIGELLRLRSEVTRLRNEALLAAQGKTSDATDPTAMAAQAWLGRVNLLRQRLEQWPGKKTPELLLLNEQDWLKEASRELDSDAACREAMSQLRWNAKEKFAKIVNEGLEQFAKANNEQLPTDLSELAPYLKPPADSFLKGYQITKPGWVNPPQPNSPNSERAKTWAMVEKGSFTLAGVPIRDGSNLADAEYDRYVVIYRGNGGFYGYGVGRPAK